MKNYFLLKNSKEPFKKIILIFFAATAILFLTFSKSSSEENLFTINDIKIKGTFDLNFSRDKYLNKAFLNSFEILMDKILLTRDLKIVKNVNLKQVKKLISSFQILEESYSNDIYKAKIKVTFNENKIKKLLREKNISFSQPEYISAVFFPILFSKDELIDFSNNYFYKNWTDIKVNNELINFILPIEDLDDVSKILNMKNKIENLNVDALVGKYDVKNYVFVLMDHKNKKLTVYIKTNFNNNKINKNISYDLKDLNNEADLNSILINLKEIIVDLWKEENLVNLLMPLSINIKFEHKKLEQLDRLRNVFQKINIIENYSLEEFDINNSYYKIYYYGNPKKLKSEFLKFGYNLKSKQGNWQVYLNE